MPCPAMAAMVNSVAGSTVGASASASLGGGLASRNGEFRPSTSASPSNFAVFRHSRWNKRGCSIKAGIRASAVDLSKIVPQGDRILLKLDSLSEQSYGGVLLPKSAVKYESYLLGEVLAVGSSVEKVSKGNKVLVSDINAYEVNLGTDDKLCFAKVEDLLAVVE